MFPTLPEHRDDNLGSFAGREGHKPGVVLHLGHEPGLHGIVGDPLRTARLPTHADPRQPRPRASAVFVDHSVHPVDDLLSVGRVDLAQAGFPSLSGILH